jgi:hypothetical protein
MTSTSHAGSSRLGRGSGIITLTGPPFIFPGELAFTKGLTLAPVTQMVTVQGVASGKDTYFIEVTKPADPQPFDWPGSPPGGWTLMPIYPHVEDDPSAAVGIAFPPPVPTIQIPVTFRPASGAHVNGSLQINALVAGTDQIRHQISGFPIDIPLKGNIDGIGPGILKIVFVDANPPGPDLPKEFVEIANVSGATVDLEGCSLGDYMMGISKPRALITFPSLQLDPISSGGKTLKIFTGVAPADPNSKTLSLKRGAPVWNNAGDEAWITNQNGELLDRYPYVGVPGSTPVTGGGTPSTTQQLVPIATRTITLAPSTTFVGTGITVEEGDVLTFAAFGWIWVAFGHSQWGASPAGKEALAPDDWPAPDEPSYSLIGRFGTGRPFWIGPGGGRVVVKDNAIGQLFLGINDIKTDDNWGPGFTCTVTQLRPGG